MTRREKELEYQIYQLQKELAQERDASGIAGAQMGASPLQEPRPPAPDDNQVIENIFTFHDDPNKAPHYIEIREAAKTFAKVVNRHAPHGQDKRKAINFIRAAVMWSNAAIALDGLTH